MIIELNKAITKQSEFLEVLEIVKSSNSYLVEDGTELTKAQDVVIRGYGVKYNLNVVFTLESNNELSYFINIYGGEQGEVVWTETSDFELLLSELNKWVAVFSN